MFDNHVHSHFSGDSKMDPQEACQAAIKIGLAGLAFTDHLDLDFPSDKDLFTFDFAKHSETINQLKTAYKGKLKVLKGIEVGLQPQVSLQTEEIVKTYDYDFVIASIHIIDGLNPYYPAFYEGKAKRAVFSSYLKEVSLAIDYYSNFDVIGHIGYIRRYCPYEDTSLRYPDYADLVDDILKKVIALEKGIEINTSGYRGNFNSPMPERDILNRYKELGGEIITLGSDAHEPVHIGDGFKQATELLLDLGFKYTAHFEERKPIFKKLEIT